MRKLLARSLAALLCLQGYPILALQETGVRARPVVPGWVDDLADWAEEIDLAARARPRFTQVGELLREAWESIELPWSCATALSSRHASAGDEGLQPPPGPSSSPRKELDPQRLQELRRAVADSDRERAGRTPLADAPLPFRQVERKARTAKTAAMDERAVSSAAPQPRRVIPKDAPAPEIVALAHSFGDSPGRIFRFVHDEIDFDPKWGAGKSPLGTLHERRGTSWEQAWLLQQLLTAAGVDARFEWGEVEITTAKLVNLTGVADAFRAGDLLTTAGVPIVLIVDGSQVVGARISHVWVRAFLDYIPNRGATPGPGDTWIRMDPSLKRFDVGTGVRLDEEVPFDLGEYLQSGTLLSPRAYYEDALAAYADAHNLGVAGLEGLKPAKSLIQEAFPFVPASTRAKLLAVAGEATDVPAAFQQQLEFQVREAGGGVLLTWSTPWPPVYGKRLELAWPGATSADQAALDLHGGVFATPPYEVDLRPVLRVDGTEVASGQQIGSAEDVELLATLTPPQGSPTLAFFKLFAGEHAALTVDFGRIPQETVDRYTAGRDAATDPDEEEGWALALAGAVYLRSLSRDLEHLSALRYRRAVQVGNVVLAVQRGAVSRSPDGTPLTFSAAPPSLDLGAMVVGLFPADGVAGPASTSVSTIELLGSQGSSREGESLAQALGGEHLTAVGFLTRASREGQTLTRVDPTNLEPALAAAELSADAEATVRAGVERGLIAWISETQLPFDTWDTTGYVLEDPSTGAGGYFVTYERLAQGLEANIVFHSPLDLDEVTAPIDVVATLEGEEIESWTLSYRAADGGPAVELASGTGTFSNETLAQFDPTLLLNGLYDIVLTARDAAGQMASQTISVSVEGKMKIGNFTWSYVDLAIPLSGLDVEVVRTYDSRQRLSETDFGYGWTLDVRQGSYSNNRTPGEGWKILEGFLPCQSVQETKSHITTLRLSDREIYRFRLHLSSPAPSLGGCFARAGFEEVDGPVPGAVLQVLGNAQVFYENGSNRVFDIDSFVVYEPEAVRLTTRDGRVFDFDLEAGVTRLADTNGNVISISGAGITHSSGESISFVRDGEGRIIEITDPRGESLVYSYDGASDLVSVTDQAGNATNYTYGPSHYLEEIQDGREVTPIRNEYDADGRLLRHVDAFGKVIEYDHRLASNQEIVTDRLGHSRMFEYDSRGNVVREVDALGNEMVRTFDGEDNLLSETDALGNTTSYSYSLFNDLVSVTDPLGNVTAYSYDGTGRVLTVTDPQGKVTTNTYDGKGNVVSTTEPTGATTSFTYDGQGNVLSETDAASHTTSFAYDGRGNLTSQVDALGTATSYTYDGAGNQLSETTIRALAGGSTETLVTSFVYDAVGRPTSITRPDGSTTATGYNALGQVISTTDPLGRATSFTYDQLGRQTATSYPDGTRESRTYDAEGRLSTVTDRGGRVTTYLYDAAGRLKTTLFADGSSTERVYDAAGRLSATIDARDNTTSYLYDAAGRRIRVINALGGQTDFVYDAAGNQIAVTDPNRHTTSFGYDDAYRLVRTAFPDGSERRTSYDVLGRRLTETDQAGKTTSFGYDALGRLVMVTDALGQVTSFVYDEMGNRVSQTDANGHTTSFEYDHLGRQTARVLPDGSRETFSYDMAGNLVTATDFLGRTTGFAYDDSNRMVTKSLVGGPVVGYSYTPTGRRATVTDARGVTSYSYDDRDRLIELTNPDGRRLAYGYDAAGNRTSLAAHMAGQVLTTGYTYDALNRLDVVTDMDGRVYDHSYDANGNRASLRYPNGVETNYTYDDLNRLTRLETATSGGDVVQSYAYTLGAAGNRTRIDEYDGTGRSYGYDALYRLTGEGVTDGSGASVYEKGFGYDPVGNRLTQVTTGAGAGMVSYSYDERDRLLVEGGQAYGWDADGRLTEKNGEAVYGWDGEDRLRLVTLADGTLVAHTYDADGVRQRTETTTPSGTTTAVDYLVDPSGPLIQVVAETDGTTGSLAAYYLRGDDLLAVMRSAEGGSWESRFYHTDGLGSIRALTNEAGGVTDRYTFTAFGELLEHAGDDPNPYLFAGEALDPNSGFYYNRARWMDPKVGRFASLDPFGGVLSDPVSLHKYLYAGDNPANAVDPTGHYMSLSETLQVIAIQLMIAAPYIQTGALILGLTAGAIYILTGLAIAVDDLLTDGAYTESLYVLQDAATNIFFISYFAAEGASAVALTRPGRGTPVRTVTVSRSRYPQSAQHIEDAVAAGKPTIFTVDRSNAAARRAASLKGVPRVRGMDRDEFPPAVFLEGGTGASVRPIPAPDNRGSGASIGRQLQGVADGEVVRLEVVN